MNPSLEATAFRIWRLCEPDNWDWTVRQIAEALDLSPRYVGQVVARKGWKTRVAQDKGPRPTFAGNKTVEYFLFPHVFDKKRVSDTYGD